MLRLLSDMHFQADFSRLKELDLLIAIGGAVSEEQDFAFTVDGERDSMSDSRRQSTGHTRERACSSSGFWAPGVHAPPEEESCCAGINTNLRTLKLWKESATF